MNEYSEMFVEGQTKIRMEKLNAALAQYGEALGSPLFNW